MVFSDVHHLFCNAASTLDLFLIGLKVANTLCRIAATIWMFKFAFGSRADQKDNFVDISDS